MHAQYASLGSVPTLRRRSLQSKSQLRVVRPARNSHSSGHTCWSSAITMSAATAHPHTKVRQLLIQYCTRPEDSVQRMRPDQTSAVEEATPATARKGTQKVSGLFQSDQRRGGNKATHVTSPLDCKARKSSVRLLERPEPRIAKN